jgi:hypothetical protein
MKQELSATQSNRPSFRGDARTEPAIQFQSALGHFLGACPASAKYIISISIEMILDTRVIFQ